MHRERSQAVGQSWTYPHSRLFHDPHLSREPADLDPKGTASKTWPKEWRRLMAKASSRARDSRLGGGSPRRGPASPNLPLSGGADLFCSLDDLLAVSILAPLFFFCRLPAGRRATGSHIAGPPRAPATLPTAPTQHKFIPELIYIYIYF